MANKAFFIGLSMISSMLFFGCDDSTSPDSTSKNPKDTVVTPVTNGDFTVSTSYDGADTLPTVLIKVLEALTNSGPVDVSIKNGSKVATTISVSIGIQDFTSAPGVVTKTIAAGETQNISPTIFIDPIKLKTLTTLTQSNYQVKVTANVGGSDKILFSETHLVQLMARDAMPWIWHGIDLTPYIAVFVTPTSASVQTFLASAKSYWSGNSFIGYQDTRIDSGNTSGNSKSIVASPPTKIFGPFSAGHGYFSIQFKSIDPVYLRLVNSNGSTQFETPSYISFPEKSYSFSGGTWNFVNTNLIFTTNISYSASYWYVSGSVRDQVKAIYNALKSKGITYSSTTISFPSGSQKVRFPEDALKESAANCIDGAVLMASALEAIGLEPIIILVPGHAFLGWRENAGTIAAEFLETTMIGTSTFEEAMARGTAEIDQYSAAGTAVIIDIKKAREVGLIPAGKVSSQSMNLK
jgi:hypothetical protein